MKKAWIFAVIVIVLAAVLIFLFRKKIFPGLTQSGTATSGTDESTRTDKFPLQKGSSGERVAKLQAYINKMYRLTPASSDYMPLVEDGIFGVKTTAACEMFLNTSSVSESWYNQYVK